MPINVDSCEYTGRLLMIKSIIWTGQIFVMSIEIAKNKQTKNTCVWNNFLSI